jgi:hypothetical protein
MKRDRDADNQAAASRFAALLVMVVLIILVLGFVGLPRQSDDSGIAVQIGMTALAAGVLFTTVRVARVSRRTEHRFGALIGTAALVAAVAAIFTSSPLFGKILAFVWVLLVLAAPVLVLNQVLRSDRVTVQTILGSITVYLLIGVSLSLVAIAMQGSVGFFERVPRSTEYVYFAFVTITSLGYGDIVPYTDGARMISMFAAVTAQMYLVIVVARLVSIWKPDGIKLTGDSA